MSAFVLLSKVKKMGPELSHAEFRFLATMADFLNDGRAMIERALIEDQCRFHHMEMDDLRNSLRWNSPLKRAGIEVNISSTHCIVRLIEEVQS